MMIRVTTGSIALIRPPRDTDRFADSPFDAFLIFDMDVLNSVENCASALIPS